MSECLILVGTPVGDWLVPTTDERLSIDYEYLKWAFDDGHGGDVWSGVRIVRNRASSRVPEGVPVHTGSVSEFVLKHRSHTDHEGVGLESSEARRIEAWNAINRGTALDSLGAAFEGLQAAKEAHSALWDKALVGAYPDDEDDAQVRLRILQAQFAVVDSLLQVVDLLGPDRIRELLPY